jgi:phosphoglycolate phosphatase-like HAD superfamily hydrolase
VIADSVALFYRLYQETCDHFGRPLPVADVTAFRGWYKARWEQNYLDMGFAEDEIETVLDHARSLVDYSDVRLFPEVVEVIRALSGEVRLGIASTTDAELIRGKLAEEGLLTFFPVVVGGEEGGSDKIARYGDALELLGVDPRPSVGVGDTPLDVHCARHWGMRTVGVTYGWNDRPRVEAARPDRLVHRPADVGSAIRSLLPQSG